jgi:ribonuclease-3
VVKIDFERLSRRLGHSFHKKALLQQALTHRSAGNENNERLEFLGDAILSFVIAKILYTRFPEETEGQLSRLRAFLVKGETLAEIALELGLGDFLILGVGELRSGGFRRESILSDALEALIAAVFLDAGMEAAEQLILKLYDLRLEKSKMLVNTSKDFKTQLQEFLQAKKWSLPQYQLIKQVGEEHDQVFHITCFVPDIDKTTEGIGTTRRRAEQQAAQLLLEYLMGGK